MKKYERSQVEEDILEMYTNGIRVNDIIIKLREKGYELSDRQMRRYIRSAKLYIEKLALASREFYIHRTVLRYDNLYNEAMTKGDLKTALATNVELMTILGYNKPIETVNYNVSVEESLVPMSDAAKKLKNELFSCVIEERENQQ